MRKCSTKAERVSMFHYMKTHWDDFDWLTLVKHAQSFCVKDEARRTDVGAPCRAINILFSACLAAEQVGHVIPEKMTAVFSSWGKKLRGGTPTVAVKQPSITFETELAALVLDVKLERIPEAELLVLMKHGVSLKGRTICVM